MASQVPSPASRETTGEQAHLFGDVVAYAPEIDYAAAVAKPWRLLDKETSWPDLRSHHARVGPAIPAPSMAILMRASDPSRPYTRGFLNCNIVLLSHSLRGIPESSWAQGTS